MEEMLHMTTEVGLPSLIKSQLLNMGEALLAKHADGSRVLQVHCKRTGEHMLCSLNFASDKGHFHAHAENYDIREAMRDACVALELQLVQATERSEAAA